MADWGRLRGLWRRVAALGWPVAAEQVFRTMMRTTDVFVTALFSPAAVVAVSLADLYANFPLRIGLGLGGGAVALSSQDTGSGAVATRDEAVTQALLMGVALGLPFAALGVGLGRPLIRVLGAGPEVVRLGAAYIGIVLATAPARHVALIGAKALQGTGDTRTPMYANVLGNVLNVAVSLILGLGLFGVARLEVVGVGIGTAVGNVLTAAVLLGAIHSPRTAPALRRPRDPTIARQLVVVSVPRMGEGVAVTLARFPFNALLLGFGTAVNAGYQIGRRLYQQVTAPLSRSCSVAASVVVGQSLGGGDHDRARFEGWGVAALGVLTVGTVGLLVFLGADPLAGLFTDDPAARRSAAAFARAFGLASVPLATFYALSGALQGASDTRVPFLGRATGTLLFMLGLTWVAGDLLGYGAPAAHAGIVLSHLAMAAVVVYSFGRGDWARRAADMMAERGSAAD